MKMMKHWQRRLYQAVSLLCVLSLLLSGLPASPPEVAQAATQGPSPQETQVWERPSEQTGTQDAPSGLGEVTLPGPLGVSVNTYNGNLLYQRTDLSYPQCGLPQQVELAYNSFRGATDSPYGYGWSLNYDISYEDTTAEGPLPQVVISWGEGGQVIYMAQPDGSFASSPGQTDTLTHPQPDRYELRTLLGTIYYFDSPRHRHVTRIQVADGRALTFGYDATGNLASVAGCYGRGFTFTYDGGHLVQAADTTIPPRIFRYAYDANGNMTGVTDPSGNAITYQYDSGHLLTRVTEPRGNRLDISYTGDRVAGLVTPLSARYFAYNNETNSTTVLDLAEGDNRMTVYQYDQQGRLTRIQDALGNVTTQAWDGQDNLVRVTDPLSRATSYTYDANGNMTSSRDALSNTISYSFDPTLKLLTSMTNGRGSTWQRTYDAQGRPASLTDPLNHTRSLAYNPATGQRQSYTDPLGRVTRYGYDAYGNLTTITNPAGRTVTYTYDTAANIVAITDPGEQSAHYGYDILGRVTIFTDAMGYAVTYGYDASGNLLNITGPDGNVVQYTSMAWIGPPP